MAEDLEWPLKVISAVGDILKNTVLPTKAIKMTIDVH